ncbi:hypothetical protein GW916_12360 [bacterium]|nr:hypothetical protein [bacterium]
MDPKLKPKSAQAAEKSQTSNKVEKALIAAALLCLLMASGALFFDDWLWNGMRSREGSIGMIVSRSGDVRLKFDQDVSWQKASRGQSLQYNDSVFAGENSKADLKLGESQLTVSQNSLVVLRREMDANFLNLSFGTLFGKVAKNEKVYIDTGSNKPTLLSTTSNAQIVLKKVGDQTTLQVVKGEAQVEVDGVMKSLGENTELALPKKTEAAALPEPPRSLDISILPPSPTGVVYSKVPLELPFKWSYGKSSSVEENQRFQLEFSKDASFAKSLKKQIVGQNEVGLNVNRSRQLFYRVKGPKGELSSTKNFQFVLMDKPKILAPREAQEFLTPYLSDFPVGFRVSENEVASNYWAQISADPEFKTILVNTSMNKSAWYKELPSGNYFVRVRSDFGEERLSDWSDAVSFRVKEDLKPVEVPIAQLENEVIIQNLPYPSNLYGASDEETREYLWSKGLLRDYFSELKPSYDQLALDFGNGEVVRQTTASFPKEKIYPSRLGYRYQLIKAGSLPSRWSPEEKLKITLEPPKENFAEVVPEQMKNDGQIPVRVSFTPVLFAKDYDFEVATNPQFRKSDHFKGKDPERNLKLALGKDYYWRVRALDANGNPLSGYSKSRKMSASEMAQQVKLARVRKSEKVAEKKRRSVASEQTQAKPEIRESLQNVKESFVQKAHNFWTWIGSGMSYVNYAQQNESGSLNSQSQNDNLGQYFEMGYASNGGYGGVVSYKIIPGEVIVTNAALDKRDYVWQMIAIEALMLRRSSFTIFGMPLTYGPRIGVQSHNVPYIYLNELDTLELKQNEMTTMSAGLMGELPTGRWKFQSYMRYQFPFSAKGSGATNFQLKPTFAFDGLVGTTYYLSQNFKMGAFWYGQWHYYNFVYETSTSTSRGSDSLFNSTLDFRLGFDF